MEGRKRKRGEHLTACQECHRLHRSCDGGRPCRRCVSTGKGATCQSLQRKPYTRKRRLSDQMGNQHVFSVFQCQSSNNAQPCANTNSQIEGDNQQILTELLQQVKQVQEITQSLQLRQQVLTKQLISLQPSSVINGIRHDPFSFGLLDDYPSTSESSPNNSSPPSFVDSPIQFFNVDQLTQPTELASNMHREMHDLVKVSHDPIQDLAFSVSNDTVDFQQSLFVPFAISDAAKLSINDWELFLQDPPPTDEPQDIDNNRPRVVSVTILSANLSFCEMAQYKEHEIVGESLFNLFSPAFKTRRHPKPHHMKKHLMPQPPNVHVSDVVRHDAELITRDGTLLSDMISNVQFFYNEGIISFGVASVLSFTPQRQPPSNLLLPPPPPSPSSIMESPPLSLSPIQHSLPNTPSLYFSPSSFDDETPEELAHHQGEEDSRFSENGWMLGSS